MANTFEQGYNSFSGVDIRGVFGNKVIAELQAISYSITREKVPIYTMGSPEPRAFGRGKRGIAGTLIFIMFSRPALLFAMREAGVQFQCDKDDLRPEFDKGTVVGTTTAGPLGQVGGEETVTDFDSPADDQEAVLPFYVDQIPPFDITLTGANEYGHLAVMKIIGVEILNEGWGISIDDIVSEQQFTYVARTLIPWQYKGRTPLQPQSAS